MIIYTKDDIINEKKIYELGLRHLHKDFFFIKYTLSIFTLIIFSLVFFLNLKSTPFLVTYVIIELILITILINYNRAIKCNKKISITEGIFEYIEESKIVDDEIIVYSGVKINGVYFNIPNEYHNELKNKLVRLFYFNTDDSIILAIQIQE